MKITLFISIFFISNIIVGQKDVEGYILDSVSNPITDCYVMIINKDTNKVIDYAQPNQKGMYKFTFVTNIDTVKIKCFGLNYITQTKIIKTLNNITKVNFILSKKKNELSEVVITLNKPKYFQKKDTTIFNVSRYKQQEDSKIIDVLERLPNMQVNRKTGTIMYKGKTVETLLLDGDDLFDYNYSIGTKNINTDIIEQVQAIERYSKNPLLNHIENSKKVAINLVLKKGKTNLSGSLDAGIGVNENTVIKDNLNSYLLGINKQYKYFVNLSHNNIGINQSPFDYFSNYKGIEKLNDVFLFANRIIPETLLSNDLDNVKTNNNNQFFGNANVLFNLSKNLKTKVNFYYSKDRMLNEKQTINTYNVNNTQFIHSDNTFINKTPLFYRSNISLKYFPFKNTLIEYYLNLQNERISTESDFITKQLSNKTNLLSKELYIKNKIIYTQKISTKGVFQTETQIATDEIPQKYYIKNNNATTLQNAKIKNKVFEANVKFLGVNDRNDKYELSIRGSIKNSIVISKLCPDISTQGIYSDTNHLVYKSKFISQNSRYTFYLKDFEFTPSYSLNFLYINILDSSYSNNRKHYYFSPKISAKYKINNHSYISSSISINHKNLIENHLYTNKIRTGYRTYLANKTNLNLQTNKRLSVFYLNSDLYNQFSLNVGISYLQDSGNYYSNFSLNNDYFQTSYFYFPKDNNNYNIFLSVSKYINIIQSTLKINSNYTWYNNMNIINMDKEENIINNGFNSNFSIKTGFDFYLNFATNANLSIFKATSNNSTNINKSLNVNFKTMFKPTKKIYISLSNTYFISNFSKLNSILLIDGIMKYKYSKKIELSLIARNMSNEKRYTKYQISDYSIIKNSTSLLPRYILINASVNF